MLDRKSTVLAAFNFFFCRHSFCTVQARVHFSLTSVDEGSWPCIIILLNLIGKSVHIDPGNISCFRGNGLHYNYV